MPEILGIHPFRFHWESRPNSLSKLSELTSAGRDEVAMGIFGLKTMLDSLAAEEHSSLHAPIRAHRNSE